MNRQVINRHIKAQSGIALVVVLWFLVLLTIVVGTYAVLARTETLQSRFLFDTVRARYAAEAGIHRAAWEMYNRDLETVWVADGRPYFIQFGDAEVEIHITNESGKIDLNSADSELLTQLFVSRGMDEVEAWHLADAIEDWRDEDDLPRLYGAELAEYEAAGYPYGPANDRFGSVDELQQVIGMSWDLFRELEPLLTVHATGRVNPAFASPEVLSAIMPDIGMEDALMFVDERYQIHPRDQQALIAPNGQVLSLQGGGRTFSIRSRARLDSGTWSEVQATVELGGDQRGRPFRVLRWIDQVEEQ